MFMSRFGKETYALMRIVVGFLFLWHGSQKLFAFPSPPPPDAPAFVIYAAGGIEFIGGSLIMIGLMTHWAGFICSGLMAAAYWMAHGFQHPLPIMNHGEPAAVYCFVFLFISAHGPGIWSVDRARGAG
jgi:putative oxidoreductase